MPLWGFPVFFVFIAGVVAFVYGAVRMSWQEVADIFRTSWEKVFRSMDRRLGAGAGLEGVTAIGVDEILWRRGHKARRGSTTTQQPAGLLGLRACGTGLRHAGGPPVRVCAAVGLSRVLRVSDAACGLQALWREGRIGALGRG